MSSKSKASTMATATASSNKALSRGQQYRRRKSVQAMESFVQKVLLPPPRAEAVAKSEGATVAHEADNDKEDNDDAGILPPTVVKALALCHERFISVVGQQLVRQLQQEAKTNQQHAESQQNPPQENASLIQRIKVDAVKNALTTLHMSHLLETVDTAVAVSASAPKQNEEQDDIDTTGNAAATTGKRRRKAAPPSTATTAAAVTAALPSSTTGHNTTSTSATAAATATTAPISRKRKKNKWTPMDEAEQERLLALSKEKLLQR